MEEPHGEPAPRRALLGLSRLRAWAMEILRAHLTPRSVGTAVALGVFVGVMPIYGLHFVACVLIARRLKLNQAVLYGAANISNPVFAPFLVAAEIHLGSLIRARADRAEEATGLQGNLWDMLSQAPDLFLDCLVGSVVIGALLGPVLGLAAAWALGWWRARRDALQGIGPPKVGSQ